MLPHNFRQGRSAIEKIVATYIIVVDRNFSIWNQQKIAIEITLAERNKNIYNIYYHVANKHEWHNSSSPDIKIAGVLSQFGCWPCFTQIYF